MNAKVLLAICIVLLSGCCGPELPFENRIEVKTICLLEGRTVNDDYVFSYPEHIFALDSVLLVYNSQRQEYSFHIFSKTTGAHLTDFGRRGRGPGELVTVSSATVSEGRLKEYSVYERDCAGHIE